MDPETIETIRRDTAEFKRRWGRRYTTNVRETVGKRMLQESRNALERPEVQARVNHILSAWKPKERQIAALLFALEGEEALHPIEVADEVDITYTELQNYERELSLRLEREYCLMLKAAA